MPLTKSDRQLLVRCLDGQPFAWHSFVDRFIGLALQTVEYTAKSRSIEVTDDNKEILAAEIFTEVMKDDFAILRKFDGNCSLATYLTIVFHRVVGTSLQEKLHGESSAEMRWN